MTTIIEEDSFLNETSEIQQAVDQGQIIQNFVISPDTIAKNQDEQPPTPIDSLSSTFNEQSNIDPATKSVSKLKNTQDLEGPMVHEDDLSSDSSSYGKAMRRRQSTIRKGKRGGSLN